MNWAGEAGAIERIVGSLTGFMKTERPPQMFLDGLRNWSEAAGGGVPAWVTVEFVVRVKERMRSLQGEWKALPFGQGMTLTFPRTPRSERAARTGETFRRSRRSASGRFRTVGT